MSERQLKELIRFASLAPSGHNTQPWKFSMKRDAVYIYPDYARRLRVVDPDDHALFIGLGCALENLVVAANRMGYSAKADYFPPDEKEECIRVTLNEEKVEADPDLFDAIAKRQATRNRYDGRPIPAEALEALRKAGERVGVSLRLLTGKKEMEPIIPFVKEGNRLQFGNPSFVNELIEWIRFSKKDALAKRDGLNAASMGLPFIPGWLGRFIIRHLATAEGEAKKCEKLILGSSALALFVAGSNEKRSWIDVGRSFERFALKAAALNIRHAHMNMPCEEVGVRKELQEHLGLENGQPLLLLRIGYSDPMPASYRRPVEDLLIGA